LENWRRSSTYLKLKAPKEQEAIVIRRKNIYERINCQRPELFPPQVDTNLSCSPKVLDEEGSAQSLLSS
jgi:hypothetical protein